MSDSRKEKSDRGGFFNMKKDNQFHRKAMCDRLLRVWDQMPDLTLAEVVCCSCNDLEKMKTLSDEVFVHNCSKYIKIYREENSIKNKIKKGLKIYASKLMLW